MSSSLEKRSNDNKLDKIPSYSSIYQIEYLTCQGGGMKGIGFVTAAEELEKHGILQQLKAVAGSSAGAIFATLVAIGCTASEIRDKMMELDFKELMDKDKTFWDTALPIQRIGEGFEAIANEVQKATENPKNLGKILGPAVECVGKAVGKLAKVSKVGASLPGMIEEAAHLTIGEKTGIAKGEKLLELVSEMITKKTGIPNATFNDLARLAETTDGRFKKLILTGSNLTPKKGQERLVYFRADDPNENDKPKSKQNKYGNLPIKEAVRISAGFPGAFKATPLIDPDGHVNMMVDGGLLENLPDFFNSADFWPEGYKDGPPKTANPNCFALSFETPVQEGATKQKIPKNLKDVAIGCLSSLTDEDPLKKKYGNKLANINTKGVGTLEFDASEERRIELSKSGGEAIRKAFRNILAEEQKMDEERLEIDPKEVIQELNKLSLSELVRLEVAFNNESGLSEAKKALRRDINKILSEKEKNEKVKEQIIKLRQNALHVLEKRNKQLGTLPLSENEAIKYCKDKIEFLRDRLQTLFKQRNELLIVNEANEIKFRTLMQVFKNLDYDNFRNKHLEQLDEINKNLEKIKIELDRKDLFAEQKRLMDELKQGYRETKESKEIHYLEELAKIQNLIKINRDEFLDEKNQAQKDLLNNEYNNLINKRNKIFKEIIKQYPIDSPLAVFFEELKEDAEKTDNFKFPKNLNEVKALLRKYLIQSNKELDQCEKLIKRFEKEQEHLEKYAENAFSQLKETSNRYSALLDLKKSIDTTIERSTTPFVAWISKYVDRRPGNERTIKNWFIRIVAGASVFAWSVGLVAIAPVSLIGFCVTAGMRKFGSPKMKAAARNIWDWFTWHDPVLYSKLKEMRGVIAGCVEVLNNSFGHNVYDVEVVYKPLAEFFKQSGINISQLKPKVNETSKQTKERLLKLNQQIDNFIKTIPEKDIDTFKKLDNFVKDILKLSTSEKRKQNLYAQKDTIEEAFIHQPKSLTKLDIQKYVAAINLLEKEGEKYEIPKTLYEKFQTIIDGARQSPTLLLQLGKLSAKEEFDLKSNKEIQLEEANPEKDKKKI